MAQTQFLSLGHLYFFIHLNPHSEKRDQKSEMIHL